MRLRSPLKHKVSFEQWGELGWICVFTEKTFCKQIKESEVLNPESLEKSQQHNLCSKWFMSIYKRLTQRQRQRAQGHNGKTLPPVREHLQSQSLWGAPVLPGPCLGLLPAGRLYGFCFFCWHSFKLHCSRGDDEVQEAQSPTQLHSCQHLLLRLHLRHLLCQSGVLSLHARLLLPGSHDVCSGGCCGLRGR